ncbi:hypothetical protein ACUR5C_11620 [Aliikangiella sp. IMCC44653]
MKRLTVFGLLATFAFGVAAQSPESRIQLKSKSSQAKLNKQHDREWHQPSYQRNVELYRCVDSWGHSLRGKFSSEQQYFIQLGGGSCRKISPRRQRYSVFEPIIRHNFDLDDVQSAVRKIERKYNLYNARVVDSENIDPGFKTFKYTLVFKVSRNQYREFRVKHDRRNGRVKKIYEV